MCASIWRLCVIYYEFCTKEIRPEISNILEILASLKKTIFRENRNNRFKFTANGQNPTQKSIKELVDE